ncbi:hypothetical protein [Litoribacillus peritrichatus]|uniref:Uncharacterized protein n=1 Tax=Litoribacillus peritrichatus TaxID=718191 RepID=A0ABP7M8S3_9GAMM
MKRPGFYQGVIVAFLLSLLGSAFFTVLTPVVSSHWALKVVITLLALAYLLYILSTTPSRNGKVTTLAIWLTITGVCWYWSPHLLIYTLIHMSIIWLARSLYYYQSALSALADLGLNGLSLVAALWAMTHTHSLFLSLWCFFLVQALFVAIPKSLKRSNTALSSTLDDKSDMFERAHRSAQAALRRLT